MMIFKICSDIHILGTMIPPAARLLACSPARLLACLLASAVSRSPFSRYVQKCPKYTHKCSGARLFIHLSDAARSADTYRSVRNTFINAVERGS